MRLAQIVVQRERTLVSLHRLVALAQVLASDPEIIPGLRVRADERRRRAQLLRRPGVISVLHQPFPLQQRARPRRHAAGEQSKEDQQNEAIIPAPVFDGQHLRSW